MKLKKGELSLTLDPAGGALEEMRWKDHELMSRSWWCYPNYGEDRVNDEVRRLPEDGLLQKAVFYPATDVKESEGVVLKVDYLFEERFVNGPIRVQTEISPKGASCSLLVCNEHDRRRRPALPGFRASFPVPRRGYAFFLGNHKVESRSLNYRSLRRGFVLKRPEGISFQMHLLDTGFVTGLPSLECTHIRLWSENALERIHVDSIFGEPESYGCSGGTTILPGMPYSWKVDFQFNPVL